MAKMKETSCFGPFRVRQIEMNRNSAVTNWVKITKGLSLQNVGKTESNGKSDIKCSELYWCESFSMSHFLRSFCFSVGMGERWKETLVTKSKKQPPWSPSLLKRVFHKIGDSWGLHLVYDVTHPFPIWLQNAFLSWFIQTTFLCFRVFCLICLKWRYKTCYLPSFW